MSLWPIIPTIHLPILAYIQPAGIRQKETCFYLTKRSLNSNYLQHPKVIAKILPTFSAKMQNLEVKMYHSLQRRATARKNEVGTQNQTEVT